MNQRPDVKSAHHARAGRSIAGVFIVYILLYPYQLQCALQSKSAPISFFISNGSTGAIS